MTVVSSFSKKHINHKVSDSFRDPVVFSENSMRHSPQVEKISGGGSEQENQYRIPAAWEPPMEHFRFDTQPMHSDIVLPKWKRIVVPKWKRIEV